MTVTEEKKSKKFAVGGGDLPPSPTSSATLTTTTTTTNKRPTRHHVKRRSSGRVHVSKLAPMARAHSNTNIETEDEVKKPMKRSQSNKSLTKLTLSTTNVNEPKLSMMTPVIPTPVEEVQVKAPSSPPKTPTLPVQKKPLLKSQFVDASHQQKKLGNVASVAATQQTGMTRTQQKLLLQREQSLIHDENNIAHPKNMIRLTREMEKMGKEYRWVRKYQDPMMESLKRCQQAKQKPSLQHTRTFSSSFITQPTLPHMEQRRQILLKTALQHQQQLSTKEDNENNKWSPSQFLDRLFFGSA